MCAPYADLQPRSLARMALPHPVPLADVRLFPQPPQALTFAAPASGSWATSQNLACFSWSSNTGFPTSLLDPCLILHIVTVPHPEC